MPETQGHVTKDMSGRISSGLRAVASLLNDKRKHRRIAIPLMVKMLMEDGTESEAIIRDISAGGAALLSEARPRPGSKVIIYIQDVGRMEANAIREHPHGFAVGFNCSKSKQEKVADKLTWLSNKARLGLAEDGLSMEGVQGQQAELILSTGSTLSCRIVGLSLNGASLQIAPRPSIGTPVVLGRMKGTVTHHLPEGVGIEFTGPSAISA